MKTLITNALTFLRLIDPHDGLISLTNTALLIVLYKLQTAPAIGLTEVGALFISLLSFQGKKLINQHNQDSVNDRVQELIKPIQESIQLSQEKMEEIQSQANALAVKVGLQVKR